MRGKERRYMIDDEMHAHINGPLAHVLRPLDVPTFHSILILRGTWWSSMGEKDQPEKDEHDVELHDC